MKRTVEYHGETDDFRYEVQVTGWYTPGEESIRYLPDGSGYPGCGASFEILKMECTRLEVYPQQRLHCEDVLVVDNKFIRRMVANYLLVRLANDDGVLEELITLVEEGLTAQKEHMEERD